MERLSHSVLLDLTICSLKKQLMLVSTSSSTFSLVIVIIIVRHASAQLIARAVTARRHAVAVVVVGVDNVSRRAHLLHLTHLRHDVVETLKLVLEVFVKVVFRELSRRRLGNARGTQNSLKPGLTDVRFFVVALLDGAHAVVFVLHRLMLNELPVG